MTSPTNSLIYQAMHLSRHEGRRDVVFNPDGKPVDDLPVIYGFNNGGRSDALRAELISEDGTHLGSHICSAEAYMPFDLGVIEGARDDRHVTFRGHYPHGYRMEFVGYDALPSHAKLNAALKAHGGAEEKPE